MVIKLCKGDGLTDIWGSLKYQCSSETLESVCDALAEVYYAAVRAFGGQDATKRADADAIALYQEKLAIYNQMVAEAKANGDIPT